MRNTMETISEIKVGDTVWTVPYNETQPRQVVVQKLHNEDDAGPCLGVVDTTDGKHRVVLTTWCADSRAAAKILYTQRREAHEAK